MSRSTPPKYFIYGVILVALYILYKNKNVANNISNSSAGGNTTNGANNSNIYNTNMNQLQDTRPQASII